MTLPTIWFFVWGLLWAIYFMTDGFDLGVGALLPFLAKEETERRTMYNATGPLWDGNEVWLITAGGVTFAAFPRTYAVMFSTFHEAFTLLLLALIARGISFEFRSKVQSAAGRKLCDFCQFAGSALAAILLGVAFANIFRGLRIVDGVHQGTILTLLNPYSLAGGGLFLTIFLLHGALVNVRVFINKGQLFAAWIASALTIVGITFFAVIGLYPNMLPSSIDPDVNSITLSNAASSPLTLKIMLGVVILFVPLVIIYQLWAYKLFTGKVDTADLVY